MIPPSADLPLRGLPLMVFDSETTGLHAGERHPVQVAVVYVELGLTDPRVVFESLVQPPVPIPPEVTKIHGIDDARVADAPTFAAIADELASHLDAAAVLAFNATYDFCVVDEALAAACRHDLRRPFGWLCAYRWARTLVKPWEKSRLDDVAAAFGVTNPAPHSAAGDAMTTALLLPRLLDRCNKNWRESSLARLWGWTCRSAFQQERNFYEYCAQNRRELPSMEWHRLLGVPVPQLAGSGVGASP